MLKIEQRVGSFAIWADDKRWYECFRERGDIKIHLSLDISYQNKHILAYGCVNEDQKQAFINKLGIKEDELLFPVFVKITGTRLELASKITEYHTKLKFKPEIISFENGILILAVCETKEEAENAKKGIL